MREGTSLPILSRDYDVAAGGNGDADDDTGENYDDAVKYLTQIIRWHSYERGKPPLSYLKVMMMALVAFFAIFFFWICAYVSSFSVCAG